MNLKSRASVLLLVGTAILALASCTTHKNTARGRFWQAFHARYNTYFNGTQAYIDASLEKEQGNVDNFTEMLPLYYVGNKNSVSLGSSNYDRAIEKSQKAIKLHSIKKRPVWDKKRRKTDRDIEWLNRKEYNPMLWRAWLLMGRSQFHKGEFDEAASTFSYMSRLYRTQPAIYCKARAWLAKCYVEGNWLYEAEDVIRNIERDSIHWSAQKEWNYTYADYFIHTGNYEKAIPYLREVIKREGRRKQKARELYLLGQLYTAVGNRPEAYKAYRRVLRQHPPYQLQFNARIAMTEVLAEGQSKKMVSKLKAMARNDNNKEYLDQVYYAMGNIYMAQKDTANAISAYEKGNKKSTRNGIEKGVLLLRLGDIYWDMEKFSDASRCYSEAIGLLDKDRKDYAQLSDRAEKLEQLVPYTESIHLQDSLQELSLMPEKERNEAIDRVIEALKKKEKEERDAAAIQAAQATIAQNSQGSNTSSTTTTTTTTSDGKFYFYNQMAVNQGKQTFQKQWGKRENVDHWRRSNRTVVDFGSSDEVDGENLTEEQRDSIKTAEAAADSIAAAMDNPENDPHKREYYLAQIPFTDEQKEASNLIIMDALYNSGVIFKDKLNKLTLSERQLTRLETQYPTYEGMANAYYHMFLLYSRMSMPQVAQGYIDKLKASYPDNQWTALLTDPYFADNQRFGIHMEDSLYAATYNAFKADRFSEIRANVKLSGERFPMGANRDKFIFIGGMGKLNAGDADGCLKDMNTVVKDYPESRVAEIAGMIVNGVKQGRRLRGGRFDMGDVWARRAITLSDQDSLSTREFSDEQNTEYVFMIAYEPDSVDGNKLLYTLAKYNFTSYMVRDFNIELEDQDGLNVLNVGGFNSYMEARQYALQFYKQDNIVERLGQSRTYIISRTNKELLGTRFSYEDYEAYYAEHFQPLQTDERQLLYEPAGQGNALDDGGSVPGNLSPILQRMLQERQQEEEEAIAADDNTITIEDEAPAPVDDGTIIIEDIDETAAPADDNTIIIEEEEEQSSAGGIDIVIDDDTTDDDGFDVIFYDDEEIGTEDESLELDGF